MIKYYCDECGMEINERIKFESKDFKIGEHIICVIWKEGFIRTTEDALCKYCVIDAIKNVDDRAKLE